MNFLPHKNQLRALICYHRKALSFQERAYATLAVYNNIMTLNLFENSQNIAFYRAHDGEVDINNVLIKAQIMGKNCYLPVLHSHRQYLDFYSYFLKNPLIKNRFNIEEPNILREQLISLSDLDSIFLPLVAFDAKGNRLGRGAGYYDRTLALSESKFLKKPVLIGISYEFQKIDTIPIEKWDIPLNLVITEKTIYQF